MGVAEAGTSVTDDGTIMQDIVEDQAALDAKNRGDGAEDKGKPEDDKITPEDIEKAKGGETEKPGAKYIPKSRYDSVAGRLDVSDKEVERLRAENESLRGNQTTQPAKPQQLESEKIDTVIGTLEEKLDASSDDAQKREIRKEIRHLNRSYMNALSDESTEGVTNEARENTLYDSTVDKLEVDFDEFNPDHKDYDQALVSRTLRLAKGLYVGSEGTQTKRDALLEAAQLTLVSSDADNAAGQEEALKNSGAQNTNSKRFPRGTHIGRNIQTQRRLAPDLSNAGQDSDTNGLRTELPEASKLTDEEIEALPEDTIKRMRGDFD